MKIMWINIANYINLQLLMLQRYQLKIYKMNLMALIIREFFFSKQKILIKTDSTRQQIFLRIQPEKFQDYFRAITWLKMVSAQKIGFLTIQNKSTIFHHFKFLKQLVGVLLAVFFESSPLTQNLS